MLCTGARILLESLKREGVDLFFGYPGGAVIDIYDELSNHPDLSIPIDPASSGERPE